MKVKKIAVMGLLIALQVIFSRFLSFQHATIKLGLGFVPVVVMALLYGPLYAAVGNGIADLIGASLFPFGPYFFGFTLSAMLTGFVYGIFLHRSNNTVPRITAAVLAVSLIINLGLGTMWIAVLYNKAFLALLLPRLLQNAVMIPVTILVTKLVSDRIRVLNFD